MTTRSQRTSTILQKRHQNGMKLNLSENKIDFYRSNCTNDNSQWNNLSYFYMRPSEIFQN